MYPEIPVPVWEQIAIVIVFAFLLAGLGWLLVRIFTGAVADLNAHYARLIKDTNHQWQQYFDARSETTRLVDSQLLERMDQLARALGSLAAGLENRPRIDAPRPRRENPARREQ